MNHADSSQFTTIRNFIKNDIFSILRDAFSCTLFGAMQTSGPCCNYWGICTVIYQVFLSYLRMYTEYAVSRST